MPILIFDSAKIFVVGLKAVIHLQTKGQSDWHVRFGSKADISHCNGYVRFTPKSGHLDFINAG